MNQIFQMKIIQKMNKKKIPTTTMAGLTDFCFAKVLWVKEISELRKLKFPLHPSARHCCWNFL